MKLAIPFLASIAAVALLASCQGRPPTPAVEARAYELPTATEVFHLRSECAILGNKILEENVVGRALTQSQNSHYNPMTNGCYVELTVQTADLSAPEKEAYYSTYLYDGQTREMLASAFKKKGLKGGMIFGEFPKGDSEAQFWAAAEFINKAMADDRKR